MQPERLVLCGGAKRPGHPFALKLDLTGRSQNITLRLEDISKKLVKSVPAPLADLVEIATYVYCADQAISRGGEIGRAMGADWRRSFRFVIPVRNPAFWSRHNVSDALCSTLAFLSEDDFGFEFEKAKGPVLFQDYLGLGDDSGHATFNADEVVLFSGGLDSLAGAIEELSSGKRVALVSHHSSSKILGCQKQLAGELNKRFPKQVMHIPVLMIRQETLPAPEYTHRSRSFLYAALACTIAGLFGKTRIRFFENGVLSINLPIGAQVVGARATRTTHPRVIEQYREFFSAAAGRAIAFDNPFIWKTKGEVVESIVDRGCGSLIKDTISCTRTHDITKLHTHCGCCSQCIDRRFAVLAAGAADFDPAEMYGVELLTGERKHEADQTMAESYVRTALEIREMGELAFFGHFAGETARACSGFPSLGMDEVGRQVLNLYQRHAQAIGNVLETAVGEYRAELVNRSLPPTSLLMMAVSPGGATLIRKSAQRDDQLKTWLDELDATKDEAAAARRSQRPREKSTPALERARAVIAELYPDGVPDQAIEPNKKLCRRVGEKLRVNKLPGVSDDTILRAAARRRK
jgi:7-cyano-7-deazaguanine synthase in queuosine biosynthesis